ncbi:hypothetical protein AK812_SmicGene3086 [Symbiodinium microadriaticum]|uniref:Uncharacterized protein n=1 Tax=Symbiodinium microadriaticum TaxID=2951 RepID=A0A1Q9EZY3_SYMMI|nr:hypothetical protein AK812_SmicGene3086 [Symbiodinium microadriaticum]
MPNRELYKYAKSVCNSFGRRRGISVARASMSFASEQWKVDLRELDEKSTTQNEMGLRFAVDVRHGGQQLSLAAAKAKECHIIIDGHLWTGRFVVWRCPVKLTYDMEVWTATPGKCVVKLGDGDYDGDFIQISAWVELLDFMDNTPSEMDAPALKQARDDILASLPERMQPVGLWTLPETALFFLAVKLAQDLQFDLEGEINMKCPLLVSLASDVYAMKALGQHRDGNVIMSAWHR